MRPDPKLEAAIRNRLVGLSAIEDQYRATVSERGNTQAIAQTVRDEWIATFGRESWEAAAATVCCNNHHKGTP